MKIILYYFSGTGNTKWAAEEAEKQFNSLGHDCRAISIDRLAVLTGEMLGGTDAVGFAFPVYGANMPNIMRRFIESLRRQPDSMEEIPAFILTTSGNLDGFGPFAARRLLRSKGFRLAAYVDIGIGNNITVPTLKAYIPGPEALRKKLAQGRDKIEKLVGEIVSGRTYITNIGPYLLPGMIIRRASRNGQRDNYLALSVDGEKCTACMRCITNCPTNSISCSDGKFTFGPACTACMRCYNFCPASAILHKGQYADPRIYHRYQGPEDVFQEG